jgi:hypothetical protein
MAKSVEQVLREIASSKSIEFVHELLLSLHACLGNKESIPRAWIPTLEHPSESLIDHLLLISIDEVDNSTHSCLQKAGLSINQIKSLSYRDSENLIKLCEDFLESLFGPGHVGYEMARMTPFSEDVSYYLLGVFPNIFNENLQKTIIIRNKKIQNISESFSFLMPGSKSQYQATLWSQALKAKINTQWQKTWLSSEIYDCASREEFIVRTLNIAESYE